MNKNLLNFILVFVAAIVFNVISQPVAFSAEQPEASSARLLMASSVGACSLSLECKRFITGTLIDKAKQQCLSYCEQSSSPDSPINNGRSMCKSGCNSFAISMHNIVVNQ